MGWVEAWSAAGPDPGGLAACASEATPSRAATRTADRIRMPRRLEPGPAFVNCPSGPVATLDRTARQRAASQGHVRPSPNDAALRLYVPAFAGGVVLRRAGVGPPHHPPVRLRRTADRSRGGRFFVLRRNPRSRGPHEPRHAG